MLSNRATYVVEKQFYTRFFLSFHHKQWTPKTYQTTQNTRFRHNFRKRRALIDVPTIDVPWLDYNLQYNLLFTTLHCTHKPYTYIPSFRVKPKCRCRWRYLRCTTEWLWAGERNSWRWSWKGPTLRSCSPTLTTPTYRWLRRAVSLLRGISRMFTLRGSSWWWVGD